MKMELRIKILKCYVWSVARYAAETWIMSKSVERRVNAFEMWTYRRINRIEWTEKISNEDALKKVGVDSPNLLKIIRGSKRRFIRSKMEKDELFKLVAYGEIPGKRSRGRRRITMLDQTME